MTFESSVKFPPQLVIQDRDGNQLAYGYDDVMTENVRTFIADVKDMSARVVKEFADRGTVPPLYSWLQSKGWLVEFEKWQSVK